MSRHELEMVLNAGIESAKRMIETCGEFHPFGVRLAGDSAVALVGVRASAEFPKGAALVDQLEREFQESAVSGQLRAAAVCFLADVQFKDGAGTQTAAVFRLAHQDGDTAEVVLPFTLREGAASYGELVALSSRSFTLTPERS